MAPLDAIKETLEVHQSQLLEKDKALHQQHLEIKKMERACSGSDLSDFAQEHVVLKQPKSVVCGRFSFCRYSGDLNIGLVWYSKVVRSLNGLLFEWCSEYHTFKSL